MTTNTSNAERHPLLQELERVERVLDRWEERDRQRKPTPSDISPTDLNPELTFEQCDYIRTMEFNDHG